MLVTTEVGEQLSSMFNVTRISVDINISIDINISVDTNYRLSHELML